ncbi:hypothetical protein CONLIGDRAFT_693298 [Coniochaeta ligniaria NRRL 30616]|uniref:Uncharacterized protein n=1 Tax=Coniochaeta ligniaria NRRL 30616 TaxID=1408157 RepID=A0A1J7I789_9PEZI|nr:hypothetical protein CONLIGDRAFT_693298 [Coniochaeta ligniaria NRRL 30616]
MKVSLSSRPRLPSSLSTMSRTTSTLSRTTSTTSRTTSTLSKTTSTMSRMTRLPRLALRQVGELEVFDHRTRTQHKLPRGDHLWMYAAEHSRDQTSTGVWVPRGRRRPHIRREECVRLGQLRRSSTGSFVSASLTREGQ